MSLRRASPQGGLTLIELVLAVAIGAILLAALNGLAKLGLDAQAGGRAGNEVAYQGRFALERIADKARATAPAVLATPAAGTTGNWFAPTGCTGAACVMYCRNAGNQLIETTTADAGCTGTSVIAANVTAFAATLPAATGPADRSIGRFDLNLASGSRTLSLSTSARLGGGTQ